MKLFKQAFIFYTNERRIKCLNANKSPVGKRTQLDLKKMKENNIYSPSLIARLAKIFLPILKSKFPDHIYQPIYNFLYSFYKDVLRTLYLTNVFKAYTIDKRNKKKTALTWKLLPYTMGGYKALENAFEIVKRVEINNIKGDLVECGVAKGGTAAMLTLASSYFGKQKRKKWFFDSFEGLPETTNDDYINGKAGKFIRPLPKGSCLGTLDEVSDLIFRKLKISKDDVYLVKGWFQNTLPIYKEKIDKIAVLRLDGDWYESTKIPLENLYFKVNKGGIIIIDDYGTCYGSKKATDQFLIRNNIQTNLIPDGRGGVWFEVP